MTRSLDNIVSGTLTNADGQKLYKFLDASINQKTIVELSFAGITAMSSSFLNSSIGDLIAKYSFENFKRFVKFKDLKPSVANQIRNYLISCNLEV